MNCSAEHSTLFDTSTTTLGPLQSFRCTRFGVTCDTGGATPDAMNTPGEKDHCHSNEASEHLTDVGRYVTFLGGLKADPRSVVFGALVGPPTPVIVEERVPPGTTTPVLGLAHS